MLVHIPNVLSADEVAHCRRVLEASPWVDGGVTAGEQARQAKFNLQIPADSKEARALGELILNALGRCPAFTSAALPLRVLPPLFNRYDTGMKFGPHVDGAIRAAPGGPRMRTDVSSTIFLTPPEDYDGGELVIEGEFGGQKVKLPAGDMVLYPTRSIHSVTEVTRGSRWASFFWTQSLVKDDGDRSLLYELDKAIIQIRREWPDDHPAVLSLTNTYHNLLRRWTEI